MSKHRSLVDTLRQHPDIGLTTGADSDLMAAAESELECRLPDELRQLYLASNGVFEKRGEWFVVWPLASVVERNTFDWDLYPDDEERADLVGFGDDGTGAPFCVRRSGIITEYLHVEPDRRIRGHPPRRVTQRVLVAVGF
ncbi:SMI1/KNR4 family protein [Nakamurella alba]|uniref:SMI1/KNR4 family protein n=1 Tax=Nakamurella alba TaxID=2665158 RepID=UPI0018AA836D|nr:SMI1/KNR4 family protein [Nakamurella alba]